MVGFLFDLVSSLNLCIHCHSQLSVTKLPTTPPRLANPVYSVVANGVVLAMILS